MKIFKSVFGYWIDIKFSIYEDRSVTNEKDIAENNMYWNRVDE